jgi:lipoprotein-anchoring transpeptidase ErfK/SrfK
LSLDENTSLQDLKHSVSFSHFLNWWQPITAHLTFKTNQPKLADFMAQNATLLISQPTNASIAVSNGTVSLKDGTVGKEYGLPNAATAIPQSVRTLNAAPLTLLAMPVNPSLTTSQLTTTAAKINQILAEHLTISIGSQVVTPTASDISAWLSLTPNTTAKTVDVAVNGAAVNSYVTGLASKAYQVERDQVVATLADGTTAIAVNGQNGVSASAGQQSAEDTVSQNLLNGKNFSVTLPVTTTPYHTITAGNWPKWIEVNLTTKRLYAYQYGQVVNTFLVSAGKPSTPTPTGTFHIWEKFPSQTMSGADYVQPNVPWVNYFDNSGDAIHGNYWRAASVFGNSNTSHGCVGLPVTNAAWVYGWAPAGTPVIIHR